MGGGPLGERETEFRFKAEIGQTPQSAVGSVRVAHAQVRVANRLPTDLTFFQICGFERNPGGELLGDFDQIRWAEHALSLHRKNRIAAG
jgi:hypothetical protein